MKLASLKEGGRDGTLIVVSRDLQRAVRVPAIAATLQRALEEWQDAGGAQPLAAGTRSQTDDAEAALIGLGYKPQEVTRVLAQIQDPADNIEGLIRQALKLLG